MSEREIDAYLLCLCDTHSADVDRKSGFVVASYLLIPLLILLQILGFPLIRFLEILTPDTHQSCPPKS
jgi:hypothetical protein